MAPKSGSSDEEGAVAQNNSQNISQQANWKLLEGNHITCKTLEDGQTTRYAYNEKDHGDVLFNNICKLWNEEKLLDVEMVSKDREVFSYHGVLLAACSTILRQVLASERVQMYNGMLAPRDVMSQELKNLQNCLYRTEVFHTTIGSQDKAIQFAVYFGLEGLVVDGIFDTTKLLKNLHQMLTQRCMTFTILKVQERQIPCHSLVLAAASSKLREDICYLYEAAELPLPYHEVELEDHSSEAVEQLLKYIYTAQLDVNLSNMAELLYSSCKLRIMSAAKGICHFIEDTVTPENALSRRAVALKAVMINEDTCCKELVLTLEDYMTNHFQSLMVSEEFCQLATNDDIIKFIVKANLEDTEKKDILNALMQWYEQDKAARVDVMPHIFTVLNIIKDPKGTVEVLDKAIEQSQNGMLALVAGTMVLQQSLGEKTAETQSSDQVEPNSGDQSAPPIANNNPVNQRGNEEHHTGSTQ